MKSNWSRRKFLQNASLGISAGIVSLPSSAAQTFVHSKSSSPHDIKIGSVSISGVNADSPEQMVQHVLGFMNDMATYKPDIICLPEVFAYAHLNGYKYNVKEEAQIAATKILAPFQKFAATHSCYIICPTYTSDNNKEYITAGLTEKYDKLIDQGLTVNKRWGTPEDVGKAVLALAAGYLPYSTGQVLMVEGGMTIQRL